MKRELFTKIAAFFCSALVFLSVSALAQETDFSVESVSAPGMTALEDVLCEAEYTPKLSSYIPALAGEGALCSESSETFHAYIADGLRNMQEFIDVSSYGYTTDSVAALAAEYDFTLRTFPDLYYVDFPFSYTYSQTTGAVKSIKPIYLLTDKEEIDATVAQIEEKLAEILSMTDDSMSDPEKLLVFHDQIALRCCYDHTLTKKTTKDLLLDGTTICQGYANTMQVLAYRSGIPGAFIVDDAETHIWNAFYLDGAWYQVDATWDDPDGENSPRILHKYFLKSSSYMTATGHGTFSFPENDSDKYDDAFWNTVTSPMLVHAGQVYFVDGAESYGTVSVCNTYTGEISTLYRFTNVWHKDDSLRWRGTFSGLAYHNGRLYFNTEYDILSCALDGTELKTEYTFSSAADTAIHGCCGMDGKLYYIESPRAEVLGECVPHVFEFPQSTSETFFIADVFEKENKRYISFINESGKPCTVTVFCKQDGRLSDIRVIRLEASSGTAETDLLSDSCEIMAFDDGLKPLMRKYSH